MTIRELIERLQEVEKRSSPSAEVVIGDHQSERKVGEVRYPGGSLVEIRR